MATIRIIVHGKAAADSRLRAAVETMRPDGHSVGGFGSRVTVETDSRLKQRLGGLAYAITGISHYAELSEHRGIFYAEDFSWEGRFLAVAIGNGRLAGGGISLCPNALIDDGMLDLMVLPTMDRGARLEVFSDLLRKGVQSIRAKLVTKRSSWIEYESEHDPNINLDGEPIVAKQFRVECCQRALPARLGESHFSQRPTCPDAIPKAAAPFS